MACKTKNFCAWFLSIRCGFDQLAQEPAFFPDHLNFLIIHDNTFDHRTVGRLCAGQWDRSGGAAFGLREASITSKSLQDYLIAVLAGRAAEEILLGGVSAGSGGAKESDLARATRLAADWELTLGLSHERLAWFDVSSSDGVGKLFAQRPDIEQQANERLKNAYGQAKTLLAEHRHSLEYVAQHLLNQQILKKDEILACL